MAISTCEMGEGRGFPLFDLQRKNIGTRPLVLSDPNKTQKARAEDAVDMFLYRREISKILICLILFESILKN